MTTGASSRVADGWLRLPRHLAVNEAALGNRFGARLGGSDVVLTLPISDEQAPDTLLAPPIDPRVYPATARPPTEWGSLSGDGTARVEMLRIGAEVPGPLGSRHVIQPEVIWTWLEHFLEWTTAWANDDAHRDSERIGYLLLVDDDGVTAVGHGATIKVGAPVSARNSSALSISEVASAALKASAHERLPLEHRLLLDAFAADDARRATIDAATAVEVALTAALSERLETSRVSEDVIAALLARTNGLTGLSQLHKELVGPVRPQSVSGRLFEELCQSRNYAVHRGVQPDAERAVDVAVRIVDHLRPLPAAGTTYTQHD